MAKIETPRPIRGTQSMFGEEAERFHHVRVVELEENSRLVLELPVAAPDDRAAAPEGHRAHSGTS